MYIKREDQSPIHAYKWRGAYNRMRLLITEERMHGVVCASAGNHAQGVALATQALETHAEVFMPSSTPLMKQEAVKSIGGDAVHVRLEGDSYDDASRVAKAFSEQEEKTFIHPYDDLAVMAVVRRYLDDHLLSLEPKCMIIKLVTKSIKDRIYTIMN